MAMPQPHPGRDSGPASEREGLSALLDGECSGHEAAAFARRWRGDVQLQHDWDTYHLIGDALRSEDLCRAGRNDHFMAALRKQLAAEPVVLAPARWSTRVHRARWMRPVSAAAGVVAVAGSVWLLPVRPSFQNAPALVATPAVQRSASTAASGPDARPRAGEWNRYLAAHQQFPSGAAVVPVSGYLRQAEHESNGR